MAAMARLPCATSATRSSGGWPYSFCTLAFPVLTPSLSTFPTSAPTSDSHLTQLLLQEDGIQFAVGVG